MNNYIALLRGINVSGQKPIKMADLKSLFEDLNYKNVATYIQSGNVLFESKNSNTDLLSNEIAYKIKQQYGWEVPVIVISSDYLKLVSENNPFINERNESLDRLYLTFLKDEPNAELAEKFKAFDYKPDEFLLMGKVLYGFVPVSYGNTKFSNNFIENKLKTTATTRNWKTVLKLLEIANC
jgi:uncharacterized protein (DUF1697 family)